MKSIRLNHDTPNTSRQREGTSGVRTRNRYPFPQARSNYSGSSSVNASTLQPILRHQNV